MAVDVGYNIYVFHIAYQRKILASQQIKVEYIFDGVVPTDMNGYALVLAKKIRICE